MRFLLDTNVLLWLRLDSNRIGAATYRVLQEAENEAYVSVATAWELAIKIGLGKLTLPTPITVWFEQAATETNVAVLPIELQHAYAVSALPHHHRDPFDRLLLAQAQIEGLTFVTADRLLPAYGIRTLNASV